MLFENSKVDEEEWCVGASKRIISLADPDRGKRCDKLCRPRRDLREHLGRGSLSTGPEVLASIN